MNLLTITNGIGLAVLGVGFVGTAVLIGRYVCTRHFPFREVAILAGLGCLTTGTLFLISAGTISHGRSLVLESPALGSFLIWTSGIASLAALARSAQSFRKIANWNEEIRKLRRVSGKDQPEPPGWWSVTAAIDIVRHRLWKIRTSDSGEGHQ